MASLYFRKKALLVKPEMTYAVNSTPTGGSNAMLVSQIEITPMEGQEISRETEQVFLGAQGNIQAGLHVSGKCMVEMAGSGTVDTPPAYAPVLTCCRLSETITEDSDVAYATNSADTPGSNTVTLNIGGHKHTMLGVRGNLTGDVTMGQIARFGWDFKGLFGTPVDAALPSTTLSAFTEPVRVSKANTAFTLHGATLGMTKFTFDLGNQVNYRENSEEELIHIPDRKVVGSVTFDAVSISTKNFFSIAAAGTLGALQMVHGTAAGNIVQVAAPAVQLGRPTYSNGDGVLQMTIPLLFVPDAGDDEIVITTK